jgi:hypothetical protein
MFSGSSLISFCHNGSVACVAYEFIEFFSILSVILIEKRSKTGATVVTLLDVVLSDVCCIFNKA